ncbi:hypothetical protein [Amycolatopsis methanolica]|uniref:hypothetical protein n=1 Tax=Amycolatopsis methanolica TaxID=1814 RepID=UPI003429C200
MPISPVSQPPPIRPARMPAEIPAVTTPSTVARRRGSANRPATELRCAPTAEPAPITASAANCAATTVLGGNRSTSGTSTASPARYPTGPQASTVPTTAAGTSSDPATSAIEG